MKFMRNGLLVLSLLALCSESFVRPHGGGGHHGGGHHGGGRGGYHRGGYRGGYRGRGGIGFGLGLGLGAVGVGLGYGNWRYGGWNDWNGGWWNTSPYWYVGNDWSSMSLRNRLNAINTQIEILKNEENDPEASNQLQYLMRRRDDLARQL
jgi:hypothetical protein